MDVVPNNKGHPSAHCEGHSYNLVRKKKDGTDVWFCSKRRSSRCPGTLSSKDGDVVSTSEHLCGPPEVERLEILRSLQNAKKRAREEDTPIEHIYSSELGGIHNKGYNFVAEMPSHSTTKRSLYRHRNQANGTLKEAKNREDVILEAELLKMEDGSSFLLEDNNFGERLIILCGRNGKESLKCHTDFFMDGTFKSCSKQFKQIYTIHADYGSSEEVTNIHPVLFALLPNKTKDTYVRLFLCIIQVIPEWNPINVTIDFEAATMSALREVFPQVEIHGCYFHMKKCLWRKVQDIGLIREYLDNEEVRLHISMCAALAFLKPEDVFDGWMEIHANAPNRLSFPRFLTILSKGGWKMRRYLSSYGAATKDDIELLMLLRDGITKSILCLEDRTQESRTLSFV